MNEENSRASIRAREAEKSHSIRTFLQARGAKKKGPNCIQIRVLLWCRKWDSALRVRSACAPRSACAAAALPGPYKSPTGAFAIRGFESLIAKQKPPRGAAFVLVPEVGLCASRAVGLRSAQRLCRSGAPRPLQKPHRGFCDTGLRVPDRKTKTAPWGGLCFGAGSGTRTHTGD